MKKIILLLLLGNIIHVNAQEFELGKVSKEELEQKSHPAEPDAEAAILYESGRTYMDYNENEGFMLVTEAEIRIKIYTKEGYRWGDRAVDYYIGQTPPEKVVFSKAVTYNLVNGAIEKSKLKSEGEFTENTNKFWAQKKIAMPNVKEGSVIEYRYTIRSPYHSNFPLWEFQTSIPVNYSKFVTKIPEYFKYSTNFRGSIFPEHEQSTQKRTYTYNTKSTGGQWVTSTKYGSETIEFLEAVTTYIAKDLPSMRGENYVSNIRNYLSSVEHELSSVKFPNSPLKNYSVTWDDVVRTIYDSDDFGGELKKTGYFEEDVATLINGMTTDEEKISAIFSFVKTRMNWNDYHGYNCIDGVKKAYKDKVGNIAEINLMLTSMLRHAGINANPVLVSTRSNGIPFFPNRTAFNYVISAVENENSVILLDASDKNSLPNIIPIRALNWLGRIVRKNGSSSEVNLMPASNSKDIVNVIAAVDHEGRAKGKVRDQYFDYNAYIYRSNQVGASQDSYLEKLEKAYGGIEIGEYSVMKDDFSKPVTENFSFTDNSAAEIIAGKLYLNPLLFFTEKENPFKQDKREYPVDFIFPHQDKYALTVTIPDGFQVESMPAPLAVMMEDNSGKYNFNITTTDKQIQIVSSLDINQAIIGPDQYETLKNFYKQVIEKQNEKIVLKKI